MVRILNISESYRLMAAAMTRDAYDRIQAARSMFQIRVQSCTCILDLAREASTSLITAEPLHQGVVQYDSLLCMTVITLSLLQYLANTPFVVAATNPIQVCIHFLAGLCKLMNAIIGRFV